MNTCPLLIVPEFLLLPKRAVSDLFKTYVQELNRVMVHDSGSPPRIDNFAEDFIGHVIYGLADLFSMRQDPLSL